jgi:hypothetical protein
MAEPLGDPEDDGVARGRPAHLGGHLASRRVANLKLSALVALGREVDAHGDEPVVVDIAVPGVPMPTGRIEPIHAPVEAADGATARDVHDELEEARVVRREQERSQGPTDLHAVLRADVPCALGWKPLRSIAGSSSSSSAGSRNPPITAQSRSRNSRRSSARSACDLGVNSSRREPEPPIPISGAVRSTSNLSNYATAVERA